MSQNELTNIRRQIETAYEAMLQGLAELAPGKARDDCYRIYTEHVGRYQYKLTQYVSDTEAAQIVCAAYEKASQNRKRTGS